MITIEKIGFHEAAAFAELSARTFYDTFWNTCTEADMKGFLEETFHIREIRKLLSDSQAHCYFAKHHEQAVGYLYFKEDYANFPNENPPKALELKRFYVEKSFHGKQVAHAMMHFFLDYAQENRYEMAWLGVWEYNARAQRFYSKYGFEYSGYGHDFPIGTTPQTDQWWWKWIV